MKNLLKAARAFHQAIQWMHSHGWTKEAYIKQYGTAEAPIIGDGGPAIWEADLDNYSRVDAEFLHQWSKHRRQWNQDRPTEGTPFTWTYLHALKTFSDLEEPTLEASNILLTGIHG